jgi:hypothetical protein
MKLRTASVALTTSVLLVGLYLVLNWLANTQSDPAPSIFQPTLVRGEVLPASEYRFTGPHTHGNLSVFLIQGLGTLPENDYLTLQEALEQKKVIVHETGDVNQLSIENRSDQAVFVQAGDVVKGGQQDRTFPYDFIAPARSGRLPIDSFCVEQGRWSRRGEESAECFDSSGSMLSSKGLKLAASEQKSQAEVWEGVARIQAKLAANLKQQALESASPSSYQLAVEHPDLQKALAPYVETLLPAPRGKTDVIGVVMAVNGHVVSAEVYGSSRLFEKLWPKLLRSAAIEAFAERQEGKSFSPVTLPAVQSFLKDAEAGRPVAEAVTDRVYVHRQQTPKLVLFDTCDRSRDNVVVHRSVLAR